MINKMLIGWADDFIAASTLAVGFRETLLGVTIRNDNDNPSDIVVVFDQVSKVLFELGQRSVQKKELASPIPEKRPRRQSFSDGTILRLPYTACKNLYYN